MPKTKLLLGLVLHFIKWISEKYIHVHLIFKLWIIKWIYNYIQFYPQAQPAKTSSAHVKRILRIFSEIEWAAKRHWICMLISKNNNLSIKLYSEEYSSIQEFYLMYIMTSGTLIYASIFLVLSQMSSSSSSLIIPLVQVGVGWGAGTDSAPLQIYFGWTLLFWCMKYDKVTWVILAHALKHIFKWVFPQSCSFRTYPNNVVIVQDMLQSLLWEHNYKVIIDCFPMLLILMAPNKSLALK